MSHRNLTKILSGGLALTVALSLVGQARAYELYAADDAHLNGDFLAVYGWMDSRKNYDGGAGGSTWSEGFFKYGLSGDRGVGATAPFTARLTGSVPPPGATAMPAATAMVPNAPPRSRTPIWAGVPPGCFRRSVRTASIFHSGGRSSNSAEASSSTTMD